MNYRHAYHAGNFADVVKHAVLARILVALARKDKPCAILDTHAGIGVYDLGAEAARTGEFEGGVGRLRAGLPDDAEASALLEPYLSAIDAMPAGSYPGSPEIARRLMRPGDRLILNELHPEDAVTLRRRYLRATGVHVHQRDAYEALPALLPPSERRGVVLIDPPFEARDEFERLTGALTKALRRWPTGIFAIWYPVKAGVDVSGFHAALRQAVPAPVLDLGFAVAPPPAPDRFGRRRLVEIGMTIVNPPWKLEEELRILLPALHAVLAEPGGRWSLDWLVRETDGAPS